MGWEAWGSVLESTAQCIHPWETVGPTGLFGDCHQGYAVAENGLQGFCKKPDGVGVETPPSLRPCVLL